jgi:hypothetical protein
MGVSLPLYTEAEAKENSLENAINEIVQSLGGYVKQTLLESGVRETEAAQVVGSAIVENNLKEKVREHILNETWASERCYRAWRDWTGQTWSSTRWKIYTLIKYDRSEDPKIAKDTLIETRPVNERVLEKARKILDKKSREYGLTE